MAQLHIEMSRNEIYNSIPYAVIVEARYGSRWNTGRTKRKWLSEFSEKERKASYRLFSMAHSWHLTKGVPDSVIMSMSTFYLWLKLGDFCASI